MQRRWLKIGWFYIVGVLAAAQLGKLSALMPLIAKDLTLSLMMAAAIISLLELGGATTGRLAGSLVHRIGPQAALLWGMGCLAVAGIGQGFAGNGTVLLGWRIVESAGYLGVVIAAPLLIIDRPAHHGGLCRAMGLDRRGSLRRRGLHAVSRLPARRQPAQREDQPRSRLSASASSFSRNPVRQMKPRRLAALLAS